MSLANKLLYLYETKKAIKDAIINKGVLLNNETFREYANAISEIPSADPMMYDELQLLREIIYRNHGGTIVFPDYFNHLNPYMFAEDDSLISIAFNDSMLEIPVYCFHNCDSLETVNFNNIEVISDHAFYGCRGLRKIELPNVKVIEVYGFAYCSVLEEIRIGNKIEEIATPSSSLQRPFGSISYNAKIYIDKPFGSLEVPTNHWGATNSTIYWNDGVQTPPNESVSKIF